MLLNRMPANIADVVIRPIRGADAAGLQFFIRHLSLASRYSRFMMAIRELPADMLDKFVHPLRGRDAAMIGSSPSAGIVGLAQYVADETGDGCEVAIVVDDAFHRLGLGTSLLTALMAVAGENGVRHVHADVLADNRAMLALARKLGCDVRTNMQAPTLAQITRTLELPRVAYAGQRASRNVAAWHAHS